MCGFTETINLDQFGGKEIALCKGSDFVKRFCRFCFGCHGQAMLKPVDLRMRENLKTTFTSEFQAWGDMLQKGRMVLRCGKFKPSGQTLPLKHNIYTVYICIHYYYIYTHYLYIYMYIYYMYFILYIIYWYYIYTYYIYIMALLFSHLRSMRDHFFRPKHPFASILSTSQKPRIPWFMEPPLMAIGGVPQIIPRSNHFSVHEIHWKLP